MPTIHSLFLTLSLAHACACNQTAAGHAETGALDGGRDAATDPGPDASDLGQDTGPPPDSTIPEPDGEVIEPDAGQADSGRAAPASCADETPPSRGCRYLVSDGTATVTRLESAPASSNQCEDDPVRVGFTFVPDDPASQRCARDDAYPKPLEWAFTIGDGKAPPRSCIVDASIVVGTQLRVRRHDLAEGPCTPVLFAFDSALVARCTAECFQ